MDAILRGHVTSNWKSVIQWELIHGSFMSNSCASPLPTAQLVIYKVMPVSHAIEFKKKKNHKRKSSHDASVRFQSCVGSHP